MDFLAAIKTILGLFKGVYKPMVVLVALSLLAIFLPWKWLVAMHIETVIGGNRPMEWIVFGVGAASLLVIWGCSLYEKSQNANSIDARLLQLSGFEKRTVETILRGLPVIKWPYDEGVVHLYADGILWREETPDKIGQYFYGLKPEARRRAAALRISVRKTDGKPAA